MPASKRSSTTLASTGTGLEYFSHLKNIWGSPGTASNPYLSISQDSIVICHSQPDLTKPYAGFSIRHISPGADIKVSGGLIYIVRSSSPD